MKEAYRQQLMIDLEVKLVFLHGDFCLLSQRLEARHGHYMNPDLLRTQFDTLEVPTEAISVDVSPPVPEIVAAIRLPLGV